MIYVHWILMVVYSLVTIGTMVTVLMDNRQPAKTVAWILVLLFLPVVGIIIYFFFGQNTRKERYISKRSLDKLTKRTLLEHALQAPFSLPATNEMLVRQFSHQNVSMPFAGNETAIYTNGSGFFLSLLREIGKATHHIHIETYIIADDPLGRLIADALIDKVREGVEVRVIYDDVGCWNVPSKFFDRMKRAGVDVQPFLPVRFPMFTSKVNYRNHRKICVIDGRLAFIGGMNFATRYIRGTRTQSWRDTHLKIEGKAVYSMQSVFLIDWYFVTRNLITDNVYYPSIDIETSTDTLAQIVTGSPIAPFSDIMQAFVRVILEARQYVYIETPYFLPTESVLFALQTAAMAGVDIRLMLPLKGDAKLAEWATRSYLPEVIKSGVKVYLYEKGFNHSKVMVCDDTICTCGSSNIDFRSFENNFEANVFFYGKEMALKLRDIFLDDQQHCLLLNESMDMDKRPFFTRLWESLVRLLSPLL